MGSARTGEANRPAKRIKKKRNMKYDKQLAELFVELFVNLAGNFFCQMSQTENKIDIAVFGDY